MRDKDRLKRNDPRTGSRTVNLRGVVQLHMRDIRADLTQSIQ